jgi:hypothetical protein
MLLFCCCLFSIGSVFCGAPLSYGVISADVRPLTSYQSYPLFADCGATIAGNTGARTLSGFTIKQSANTVVTDNDTDTKIAGKALFELKLKNTTIINGPADDLIVYETTNPEPFSMSVFDSALEKFTSMKIFVPTRTGTENSCGSSINVARIDLSTFGIPDGDAISLFLFDNLGDSGGFTGADIADIVPINHIDITNMSR